MNKLKSGVPIEFVCQSTGSKPPANIKWYIGTKVLENLGESVSEDGSVTTSFLSYVPSIEDNGKRLSCVAANVKYPGINVDDGFVVHIKYSPAVSLVMGASVQREQIVEGSDILFECNIQANPMYSSLGWMFNDQQLNGEQFTNVVISNTSLLLKSVRKQNSGSYRCWAVNDEGKGESDSINLNIQCKRQIIGVTTHEEASVDCEVDALPPEVTFYWIFNNSQNEVLDVATFTATGVRSTATYTPHTIADFGILFCFADNSVGRQREPCQYFIVPASPPEPPNNCTVNNVTIHSLSVECEPGYSGGLQQTFHLEIYTKKSKMLLSNQSSSDYPFFTTHLLPAGHSFTLLVYSSNSKGKSETLTIKGSTLLASQLFSVSDND
ncbi:Nephrin-like protein, partial [Leptotrombidium deliense]